VKVDLHEQVAEFFAQVGVRDRFGLDRLGDLGGLLDQVFDQAAVALLGVPRAFGPQSLHHLGQPQQLTQEFAISDNDPDPDTSRLVASQLP